MARPDAQRDKAVWLRRHGQSQRQIARELAVPLSTVKAWTLHVEPCERRTDLFRLGDQTLLELLFACVSIATHRGLTPEDYADAASPS